MTIRSAKLPIHEIISARLSMEILGVSKETKANEDIVKCLLDMLSGAELKPEHAAMIVETHKGLPALFTDSNQLDLAEFATEVLVDLLKRGVDNPADDEAPDAILATSATGALVGDEVQSTEREREPVTA